MFLKLEIIKLEGGPVWKLEWRGFFNHSNTNLGFSLESVDVSVGNDPHTRKTLNAILNCNSNDKGFWIL